MSYSLIIMVRWDLGNDKDEFPIYFRLTVSGKRSFKSTGYSVKRDDWNEDTKKLKEGRGREYNKTINQVIDKDKRDLEEKFDKLILKGKPISFEAIKKKQIDSFFKFCEVIRWDKKITNNAIYRIKEFTGQREPSIHEIDKTWLRMFEAYLRDVMELEGNTVHLTFKFLRRVLNQAALEEFIDESPLGGKKGYPVPPEVETDPVYLVEEERLKCLAALDNPEIKKDPRLYKTLVYFLLGCYSGLRYSDWLQFDPYTRVQDGLIHLRAHKNGTLIKMEIGESLARIIEAIKVVGPMDIPYSTLRGQLDILFPLPGDERHASHPFKGLGIQKNIGTHSGRHTFGFMCASTPGITQEICALLLGIDVKTAGVYYHHAGHHITQKAKPLIAVK